jgi:hypothetical protein
LFKDNLYPDLNPLEYNTAAFIKSYNRNKKNVQWFINDITKTLFVVGYDTMADLLYTGFKKDSSTFLSIMRNQSKPKGETWHN